MLIKGITQLNQVISETERNQILIKISNSHLADESGSIHYGNSSGRQLEFDEIFDRLTTVVSELTNLKLSKENSYSRIYRNGSYLRGHTDREGLDLTLSIQIDNTFDESHSIFARGYDGTVYESKLNNSDGVLIKGRELEHWRPEINGMGSLICVFFHWKIESVEYQEIDNFLTGEECDAIINEGIDLQKSMVLINKKVTHEPKIRDNEVGFYKNESIDEKVKSLFGNLKLEGLQILKYSKGNKFTPHFDEAYGDFKRLFTVIIYLNDDYVGGETNFVNAKIKIKPQKGKLLIWKNSKASITDPLTLHESLPIKKGVKFALVNWGLV